ncbi:MAG: hypothetical protein AABM67_14565 [Acidobacteriota bacterium]
MKQPTKKALLILAVGFLMTHAQDASAQPKDLGAAQRITKARVDRAENAMTGSVYATIGGTEKKISEVGIEVLVIEGGRRMVYSGLDGSGGFENEGQSLYVYDPRTDKKRKVMSEYFIVNKLTEVTTSRNKTALLVDLTDGGLGASYQAVVDPNRGEVFFRRWSKVLSRRGDIIVLGRYKEDDWEKFVENENAKVRPYRTERYNLNTLLRRKVIVNKRDNN